MIFIVVLICSYLVTNDTEHLSNYLLAILAYPFVKHQFKSFAHLKKMGYLFILECGGSLF